MTDYQLDEPSNKFVEFVRVRSSDFPFFPEAIILYNSTTRGNNYDKISYRQVNMLQGQSFLYIAAFTVQLGFKMKDVRVANERLLQIITTTGSTVTIIRKKRGNNHNIALRRHFSRNFQCNKRL